MVDVAAIATRSTRKKSVAQCVRSESINVGDLSNATHIYISYGRRETRFVHFHTPPGTSMIRLYT